MTTYVLRTYKETASEELLLKWEGRVQNPVTALRVLWTRSTGIKGFDYHWARCYRIDGNRQVLQWELKIV